MKAETVFIPLMFSVPSAQHTLDMYLANEPIPMTSKIVDLLRYNLHTTKV